MVSAWQRAYLAIDLFATGSVATRAHPLRFVVDLVHIHHHAREAAQRGSVQRVRVDASAPLAAERVLVGRERRAGHRAVLRRASVHLDGRLVRVLQLGRQHVVVHFHHRHAHREHISIRSHRGEHRALVCELRLSGLRSALSLGIRLSLGLQSWPQHSPQSWPQHSPQSWPQHSPQSWPQHSPQRASQHSRPMEQLRWNPGSLDQFQTPSGRQLRWWSSQSWGLGIRENAKSRPTDQIDKVFSHQIFSVLQQKHGLFVTIEKRDYSNLGRVVQNHSLVIIANLTGLWLR